MNSAELITLEGELKKLSFAEIKQLNKNPDLLGVWITAALTAVKGASGIGKKIVKARKKALRLKKSKAKKKTAAAAPKKTNIPIPSSRTMITPAPYQEPKNKQLIIIGAAAAAALFFILQNKKGG